MVDFRYHLVSIIAVFLALALGIVVGTTALNGRLPGDLEGRIDGLTGEKRALEDTVGELRETTDGDARVLEQLGPGAVDGRLAGRRVVVVSTPNAPSELREELVPVLEEAGATVSDVVTLRPDLLDPAKTEALEAVVDRVAPDGAELSGDPVQRASQELAAALLEPVGEPGLDLEAGRQILSAFVELDLIALEGEEVEDVGRASLAVLLTGEPVGGADVEGTAARITSLVGLAGALDAAGDGAVVGGPVTATDEGGLLRALREDDAAREAVSTVDGLERITGRLVTVLALQEQATGIAGRYGTGEGADEPLPGAVEG